MSSVSDQLSISESEARIRRVCDYVQENLENELTLEHLSNLAHCSKFHFHRQFAAQTGITLAQFVTRLRLKRASYQLVFHPELGVAEIALGARYENPESFSRAFKRAFDQSPTEFRSNPLWEPWHEKFQFPMRGEIKYMKVETVYFEEKLVAVKVHRGHPATLNESIAKFIEWRKTTGLSPVGEQPTYGVPFGDPKRVEPQDFRFHICGVVENEVPDNPQGVTTKRIPAGRCAKLTHRGSHDLMEEKIYYLYRDWLPESQEKPRDFPCFFHYRNFYPEVAESELVTDIYIPLQEI